MSRLGNILNGIINPFGKVLWEGTWSSGSLTVNGISKYSLLMMEQAGEPIIVVNDGSVLRGMSMAASGVIHYGRAFSSNISGDTLTLPGASNISQIPHTASGNHSAITYQSITKIVGLVPNWGGVTKSLVAGGHFLVREGVAA